MFEARHPDPQRLRRTWITESLLVLAIVAFGFFAVMLDALPNPWQPQNAQGLINPTELLR